MAEREHKPNFLERLGDGRWFGHGRRFGVQVGSIEQRASDPFYRGISTDIVKRYWLTSDSTQYEVSLKANWARFLAEQVNAGTAGMRLIPTIDKWAKETGKRITPGRMTEVEFAALVADRMSILWLYESLMSSADTLGSIPYLLQALRSSVLVRELVPFERTTLHVDQVVEEDIWLSGGPGNHYDEGPPPEHRVSYCDVYTMRLSYNAWLPFAEMAKVKLLELIPYVDNRSRRDQIAKSIKELDGRIETIVLKVREKSESRESSDRD